MKLKEFKNRLAQIRQDSWHYQLVQEWGFDVPNKACAYYWVCIPSALLAKVAATILYVIFAVFGYFAGFTIFNDEDFTSKPRSEMFHP